MNPRHLLAKQKLATWARAQHLKNSGVAMGMTEDALAPQHALWVLEYVAELETALKDMPSACEVCQAHERATQLAWRAESERMQVVARKYKDLAEKTEDKLARVRNYCWGGPYTVWKEDILNITGRKEEAP